MFCGECGTENPETNKFCKNCGNTLKRVQQTPAPTTPVQVPAQSYSQPVSAPAPQVQMPGKSSVLRKHAISIISIFPAVGAFFMYPYVLGIVAIILGLVAIKKRDFLGIIVVAVGLAAIVVDLFYLQIFPPIH
jgi:hypothetical protein